MKSLFSFVSETFNPTYQEDLQESFASENLLSLFSKILASKYLKRGLQTIGLQLDKITDEDLTSFKFNVDFNDSNVMKKCKDDKFRIWFRGNDEVFGLTKGQNAVWSPDNKTQCGRNGQILAFKTVKGAARLELDAIEIDEKFGAKSIKKERFLSKQGAISFKTNSQILSEQKIRLNDLAKRLKLTKFQESGGGKDLLLETEKLMEDITSALDKAAVLQDWQALGNLSNTVRYIASSLGSAYQIYSDYGAKPEITDIKITDKSLYSQQSIKSYIDSAKKDLEKIQQYNNID